jgi:hypothetical protein
MRHADEFGLGARERGPEGCARSEKLALRTMPVVAAPAPPAVTAGRVVGSGYTVTDRDGMNTRAGLDDIADELMTEHGAGRKVTGVGDDMHVCAADGCLLHPHDRIVRFDDGRVGHRVEAHFALAGEDDGTHDSSRSRHRGERGQPFADAVRGFAK